MAIPSQSVPVLAGTAPTFSAPLSADTVEVGTILIVKNGSGASVNVTLDTPGNLNTGDAYPDKVYAVPAAGERWIPILPDYRQPSGLANVAFAATASVTTAAIYRS
jgi:hypothetical protein